MSTDDKQRLMSLYNGKGEWADKYGKVTIQYYDAFKKYNEMN